MAGGQATYVRPYRKGHGNHEFDCAQHRERASAATTVCGVAPIETLGTRRALRSGNFYREVLPAMYDANVIDQERFGELLVSCNMEHDGWQCAACINMCLLLTIDPCPRSPLRAHPRSRPR